LGAVACRWIEPLTMNRAAPEESRGGPINYQTRTKATWFPKVPMGVSL
jgi:hypothetical protein